MEKLRKILANEKKVLFFRWKVCLESWIIIDIQPVLDLPVFTCDPCRDFLKFSCAPVNIIFPWLEVFPCFSDDKKLQRNTLKKKKNVQMILAKHFSCHEYLFFLLCLVIDVQEKTQDNFELTKKTRELDANLKLYKFKPLFFSGNLEQGHNLFKRRKTFVPSFSSLL